MKEILLVALRAGEAAGRDLQAGEAKEFGGVGGRWRWLFSWSLAIAHYAALADVVALQFKLWFDEDEKLAAMFAARNCSRQEF